ncbi:MAG: peptidoglycan bridge formation glycyltransferase FemA/FemB family protein [Patescibacteria group bacterium]
MTPAQEWNDRVRPFLPPFGGFLQSYEWGEFQESLGFKVKRVFEESKKGTVVAQCIEQPLRFGKNYFLIPKGPLGDASAKATLDVLIEELSGASFLKIEPPKKLAGTTLVHERHPFTTAIVDLSGVDNPALPDTLLERMKPKTRYNIKLAEKKGVTIRIAREEAFDEFMELMKDTAKRDGFALHQPNRYLNMLKVLKGGECKAYFAFADFEGKALAANLMIDSFGQRTYLHGASSSENRNVMAPYALHWHLIKDAVEKGMTMYDFWGIAPVGADENHPWNGITRFKLGFGADVVVMPGTFDVPISKFWYNIYKLARKASGLK